MAKKPVLDEPTLLIARTLLNTPPKPHEEMKVGKSKRKKLKMHAKNKPKKPTRDARDETFQSYPR